MFKLAKIAALLSLALCARLAAGEAPSEQIAKQEQELAQVAQNPKAVPAKDFMKMALLLNIQKSITANGALKQSVRDHDAQIANLELALEKKQQTWFDWAASFFKAAEPKKPRPIGQFKTELAAAAGAYAVSKGNAAKFDIQFLGMVWKKQKIYEAELKKIIEKQKEKIDRLQAQL